MTKKYQKKPIDTSALSVPERVSVVIGEIAADLEEGWLALAVGAGLQVMAQLMEADVAALCGPKGKHDPDRTAVRGPRWFAESSREWGSDGNVTTDTSLGRTSSYVYDGADRLTAGSTFTFEQMGYPYNYGGGWPR